MSNRFLDIYGVEHYHNLIKTEAVTATQAAATNVWTGELDASGLAPGKSILYTMPDGSTAGAATLELTLADGTTTGAKAVKTLTGANAAPAYQAGSILHMVYDGTNWTILNRPEILPITMGGTGATTASAALTNLGAAASGHKHAAEDITSGTLAVARGGTGATTASAALTSLGAAAKSHSHTLSDISGGLFRTQKYSIGVQVQAESRATGSKTITSYSGYKPIGVIQVDGITNGGSFDQIYISNDTTLGYTGYNRTSEKMNIQANMTVLYLNTSFIQT